MNSEVMTVLFICTTIVLLAGMWFLSTLVVLALDKPDNAAKVLTAFKEHRFRE